MTAFGALPETAARWPGEARSGTAGFAAVAPECWLVVEPNGFEGIRPELLRSISATRSAGAVQWNINGSVYVAAARRGRMVFSGDLLLDETIKGLPRALHAALPRDRAAADLPLVALDIVSEWIGIDQFAIDLEQVSFFDIESPVVEDLFVTPAEDNFLRYDAPELLKMIKAMDRPARRELAAWCALQACAIAGLDEDPRLSPLLEQLAGGTPIASTDGLGSCAAEAAAGLARADRQDPYRRADRGPSGLAYLWAWQRKMAVYAVRACCLEADELAAIGAVEGAVNCASARGVARDFRKAAAARFAHGGRRMADDWQPPPPLTAEQKLRLLEGERKKVARERAKENAWMDFLES